MKALRAELQQPEAYLREQLDRIAVLAKSGRFATNWSLKPEMMTANSARDEEEAANAVIDSDMDLDDDDDDADVKFEDV
jgi:transcription initiation factor TFIIF subunit beta